MTAKVFSDEVPRELTDDEVKAYSEILTKVLAEKPGKKALENIKRDVSKDYKLAQYPRNSDLLKHASEEQFDNHIRIADYFTTTSSAPYIMALGTRNADEALRTWKSNQEFLRGPQNKPIMDFTGFDTLEYLRGGEVAIQHLLDAVAKIKISKDLGIGILKPGLRLTQEIMNMADTYFRIISIDKCPCIYGVKPKTMIYGIVNDVEKGAPNIKLIPIV